MSDLGYAESLASLIRRWGPILLFASLFIEAIPLFGFILPGLTILVVAGFLAAGQSLFSAILFFIASLAGLILADTLMFWLGREGATRLRIIERLTRKHDVFRQEIAGQSLAVLLLYQFPPYSRMFAPLLMGALSFTWRRWLFLVSVGSIAFVSAFFGLGLTVGLASRNLSGAVSAASTISALFMLCLLIWATLVAFKLRRVNRHPLGTAP